MVWPGSIEKNVQMPARTGIVQFAVIPKALSRACATVTLQAWAASN
jgi:hypothetical protein